MTAGAGVCRLRVVLAAGAAVALLGGAASGEAGARLFDGRDALTARITGHESPLPPVASRCTNCHAGAQPVGGDLASARLQALVARRGGPPSRYDADTLCRLLRTGIDPAWILVDRTMPRFDISDEQCRALWSHLKTRRSP